MWQQIERVDACARVGLAVQRGTAGIACSVTSSPALSNRLNDTAIINVNITLTPSIRQHPMRGAE